MRPVRKLLAGATLAACLITLTASPSVADPLELKVTPVPLFRDDLTRAELGRLVWRGGLDLTSADRRFGGLSALAIRPDGKEITAFSDHGFWVVMTPDYRDGKLVGISGAELGVLAGEDGRPLEQSAQRDAESVAVGVDGAMIIAFERNHRLWAYPPGEVLPSVILSPDEVADAPSNGGIEALTLLQNGKLFAVTEDFGRGDSVVGWISDRKGWDVVTVRTSGTFKPTGAATLSGGDVLLLERRFGLRGGIGSRIRRLSQDSIRAGAVIDGPEIARLDAGATFDNMEGIGTWMTEDGRQMVYLVSDDNYSALQRTYLMLFELMAD
ncbi:MAG: esterase-like activity of phytase family protein [Rhodospirillales bacterium]